MAITRQTNWLGQERVDVPDMRGIESAVANDFDLLAGKTMGGKQALVVRGFTIDTTNALGNPATNLVLSARSGILAHWGATEAGTLLQVSDTQADDALNSTNSLLTGGFAASSVNYVGIDYLRQADATTADTTKFVSAATQQEISRVVPKGRILGYKIIISTSPFSLTSNICPIARVQTDSSNRVISVTDARQLFFRLGSGGDVPSAVTGFTWPDTTRFENNITYASGSVNNPFNGGDKGIDSFRSWMQAAMHVMWESKSGEYWYSRTTRDGAKLAMGSTVFGNGDNFTWNSGTSTLSWTGLSFLFENSSGGFKNNITDGSAVLLDGQCLYIDLDRQTITPTPALVPVVANLQSVSAPTIPGARFILAWRNGADIHLRDRPFNIERLAALFGQTVKRYPNIFVSANVGEGDSTTLAGGVALLPAYGGVLILMSDLTIAASVTLPANCKLLARAGVTLTLSGVGTELILNDRAKVEDLVIASSKTSGVLLRMSGFRNEARRCIFNIAPAGTAVGVQIDGNVGAVHSSEFTGVIAPSTGVGIQTGVGATDFYIAGDNAYLT